MKEEKIKVKEQRNSNIELLRIIAMSMIVFYHMTQRLGIFYTGSTINKVIGTILTSMGIVGVDIFMIISGYFLINKKFTFKKIFKLVGQVFFYSILMMSIYIIFDIGKISYLKCIKSLLPITSGIYWFASSYFIVYLIFPILNSIIKKIDKNDFKKLLIIIFILFSVIYTFLNFSYFSLENSAASNLMLAIYLYMLGAYIRLYDIKCIKNKRILINFLIIIMIIYIGLLLILNFKFNNKNDIMWYYMKRNSLFVILISSIVFLIFKDLKIKQNTIINECGKASFAVYLIHENHLTNNFFWIFMSYILAISDKDYINTLNLAICSIIILFIVAITIEFFRKKLEKIILENKTVANIIEDLDYKYNKEWK